MKAVREFIKLSDHELVTEIRKTSPHTELSRYALLKLEYRERLEELKPFPWAARLFQGFILGLIVTGKVASHLTENAKQAPAEALTYVGLSWTLVALAFVATHYFYRKTRLRRVLASRPEDINGFRIREADPALLFKGAELRFILKRISRFADRSLYSQLSRTLQSMHWLRPQRAMALGFVLFFAFFAYTYITDPTVAKHASRSLSPAETPTRFALQHFQSKHCFSADNTFKDCSKPNVPAFRFKTEDNIYVHFDSEQGYCIAASDPAGIKPGRIVNASCDPTDNQIFKMKVHRNGSFVLQLKTDESLCAELSPSGLTFNPCDPKNPKQRFARTLEHN